MDLLEQRVGVRFSVIMPVFNRESFLRGSLGSVISQVRKPDEIVICDDGSTDSSVALARSLLENSGIDFQILRVANGGPSRARAKAVSAASCSWLVLLDSDDLWKPEYLSILESLITDDEPECVVSNFCMENVEGKSLLESKFATAPEDFWSKGFRYLEVHDALTSAGGSDLFLKTLNFQPCYPSALAFTRAAYDRAGGIEPMPRGTKSEDSQLTRKLYFECKTAFLRKVLVTIVLHGGNRSLAQGEVDLVEKFKGRLAILRLLYEKDNILKACGPELLQEIYRSDRDIFNQLYWTESYREAIAHYRNSDHRFFGFREHIRFLLSALRAGSRAVMGMK